MYSFYLLQPFAKRIRTTRTYRQLHRTQVIETLFEHFGTHLLDHPHHIIHYKITELHLEPHIDRPLDNLCCRQHRRGRLLVGRNQSDTPSFVPPK